MCCGAQPVLHCLETLDLLQAWGQAPSSRCTPEGPAAKAAAICAQDDATSYSGDYHDDACALFASLARDAAGAAYRPLDKAAV